MSFNIELEGGVPKRLNTKGKYCDRDIVVTPENLDEKLVQQDTLIEQIKTALRDKVAGGTSTIFKDFIEGTLVEVNDDTITTIKARAFNASTGLKRVSLLKATNIGQYAFAECTELVSVDLPSLDSAVPTFCFDGCTALKNVNFPNATAANNYSFQDCVSLEKVELGVATIVGSYSFRRTGVTALIIRNNTTKLTKLNSTNAFSDCPIASGTGYIYFYRQYVDSYKSATGWSNYASQIRAIEDYPEITGG